MYRLAIDVLTDLVSTFHSGECPEFRFSAWHNDVRIGNQTVDHQTLTVISSGFLYEEKGDLRNVRFLILCALRSSV